MVQKSKSPMSNNDKKEVIVKQHILDIILG